MHYATLQHALKKAGGGQTCRGSVCLVTQSQYKGIRRPRKRNGATIKWCPANDKAIYCGPNVHVTTLAVRLYCYVTRTLSIEGHPLSAKVFAN
jgi:hypothetical protein